MSQREISGGDRRYNRHTGKGPKAAGWRVARSSDEVWQCGRSEGGHAEIDSFDREVRQGRGEKTFYQTARTEGYTVTRKLRWMRRSSRLKFCESAPSGTGV